MRLRWTRYATAAAPTPDERELSLLLDHADPTGQVEVEIEALTSLRSLSISLAYARGEVDADAVFRAVSALPRLTSLTMDCGYGGEPSLAFRTDTLTLLPGLESLAIRGVGRALLRGRPPLAVHRRAGRGPDPLGEGAARRPLRALRGGRRGRRAAGRAPVGGLREGRGGRRGDRGVRQPAPRPTACEGDPNGPGDGGGRIVKPLPDPPPPPRDSPGGRRAATRPGTRVGVRRRAGGGQWRRPCRRRRGPTSPRGPPREGRWRGMRAGRWRRPHGNIPGSGTGCGGTGHHSRNGIPYLAREGGRKAGPVR